MCYNLNDRVDLSVRTKANEHPTTQHSHKLISRAYTTPNQMCWNI